MRPQTIWVILAALIVLYALFGFAQQPHGSRYAFMCAVVETGAVTFDGDEKMYPAMTMVCDEQ